MTHTIHLSRVPNLPPKKTSKTKVEEKSLQLIGELSSIQDKLYAQKKYSVLIVLQGMDTAGKDSAVKHVFSGVNPAGCNVKSFKVPTDEETSHHFLWRSSKECPETGMIKIFNRSYYEDVLISKVDHLLKDHELKDRCEEINAFEKGLINNNTILLKFFLHISQKEQLQRHQERKDDPGKRWKYQKGDAADIKDHAKFEKAYEFVFKHCSKFSHWHIIPADKKWYKNYLILKTIVSELQKYNIAYPDIKLKGK